MIELDAVISGVALDTDGFLSLLYNVAGLSLITDGFLAPCDAIWTMSDNPALTTTWVDTDDIGAGIESCLGA